MTAAPPPYADALTDAEKQSLKALSGEVLSEDAAWERYGRALGPAVTGKSPIEGAKKIFNRKLEQFRKSLCDDPAIQTFIEDPQTIATFDLLLVLAGKLKIDGMEIDEALTGAVLVSQIGLMKICAGR